MPQLARAAMYHFLSFKFLRWAYHAKVIKIFDNISSVKVLNTIGILDKYLFKHISIITRVVLFHVNEM